jgi:hypothetical protein
MPAARTIDEVIHQLDIIIRNSETKESPLGYFAALYRKVTIKVRDGIRAGFFTDGPRMERLDVIFANRYLEAYDAYQQKQALTSAWLRAFRAANWYQPIVLQHLLAGMNAHISLDLGIAAAEVSIGADIETLQEDFNRINTVLASLVQEVQDELAQIWPGLLRILRLTGQADDFMVNFSMEIARDAAWAFAASLATQTTSAWPAAIRDRDKVVADHADLILRPGVIPTLVLLRIRLAERGSVRQKIATLT